MKTEDVNINDQLAKSHFEELEAERLETEHNKTRIFNAIENTLGAYKLDEVQDIIEDCELGQHPFSFCKEPKGELQTEGGLEWYVNQSAPYGCEDCFYGEVYVELKPNKWLCMPFST